MTLLTALAAATATSEGGTPPAPNYLVLSPSVNIVFDGDSITDDFLATGMDTLVSERLTMLGKLNGASISNSGGLGVPGQTWADMRTTSADLAAAWIPGKTNVLVAGETTNSVFNTGRSAAQTISDASAYIAMAAGMHPWIILLWGTIPRGHADEATYAGEAANNTTLISVDTYMQANYTTIGAHGYADVRSGTPMFDHNGSNAASFVAYQSYWNEAPPNVSSWSTLGWVHPKDGVFPVGSTPGTGKRAIAAKIATAIGLLPATI